MLIFHVQYVAACENELPSPRNIDHRQSHIFMSLVTYYANMFQKHEQGSAVTNQYHLVITRGN